MIQKMKVGLIGTGLMGHAIGKNIVEKGFALHVMAHRNRQPIDDLCTRGAVELSTASEMANQCSLIITCVTGSPQVEALVYGSTGILEGVGDGFVLADCSTAMPASSQQIAGDIRNKGGDFVDIPMSRTPAEAIQGKLALMMGGDHATLDRIKPVLDCFADTLIYAGDVGAGHTVKILHNFLALGQGAVIAEGIAAAKAAGVSMEAFNAVCMSGGARSLMLERFMRVILADDQDAMKFYIQNASKDLGYYAALTESLSTPAFVGQSVRQIFKIACNMGYGEQYVPEIVKFMGTLHGEKRPS
jgi:3-hydroxyisobutyrate dehydrogenase-like beta-hydroxyacid dehydrogenase